VISAKLQRAARLTVRMLASGDRFHDPAPADEIGAGSSSSARTAAPARHLLLGSVASWALRAFGLDFAAAEQTD
jgi:hypothetical protein